MLCNRGDVEDVGHFVLNCGEFTAERRKLVRKIRSLIGAERWGEEYDRDVEEKKALLGKRVEGVERDVMDVVDGWLLKELLVWWRRRKDLLGWT